MKSRRIIISTLVAMALLVLALGFSQAQGPGPSEEGAGIQTTLDTVFTYQGQLKKGGKPVSDTCDFQFSLWDDETGGNQIGPNQDKTISVSNGLFTVQLDFGPGAFQGDARWLQIAVACTGDPAYVTLYPRQKLTPAPYALALPGLWTQPNATSPNLIGGYSGNWVTSGTVGATIGGGGTSDLTNRVTDDYSVISGGVNNQAGNNDSDPMNAAYTTVGGGSGNQASGWGATVGGGVSNTASDRATVGGGYGNTATLFGTVSGGWSNSACASSAVGGGRSNDACGRYATIGGGLDNRASYWAATVGGGESNTASGSYATVPGGYGAAATHYAQMAYASGVFGSPGDAQASLYVLRNTTTSAITQTELFLDGSHQRITITSGRTMTFDILVVGREDDNGESAGYQIRGVIERVGDNTAFVGSVSTTILGKDDPAWDVSVIADDAYDALCILVQGGDGDTVRWVAVVRTAEVTW